MAQALLAYTLPNGTEVLIPALDSKEGEMLPLIFYGNRPTSEESVDEDHNTQSVFLSGIEVPINDLDSIMDTASSIDSTNNGVILRGISLEQSLTADYDDLKNENKQTAFENAVIINSDINGIIELHKLSNESESNIVSEILLRTQPVGSKVFASDVENEAVKLSNKDTRNILKDFDSDRTNSKVTENIELNTNEKSNKIETICIERVIINDILKRYKPVDIPLKPVLRGSIPSEMDSFVSDCDSPDGVSQNTEVESRTVCLKQSIKNLENCEKTEECVTLINYVEHKHGAMKKINRIPESLVSSSSDSVLQITCPNVELSVQNGEELIEHSNSAILDNLDEFAEMVMWFKCRLCKFAAGNKKELLDHLQMEHLEGNAEGDSNATNEESDHPPIVKTDGTVSEKFVFLCGQCSAGFNSLEACKTHMMEVHELIVQENESGNNGEEKKENELLEKNYPQKIATQKKLLVNQKSSPSTVPFKCSVRGCQSKFNNEKDLNMHLSCHSDHENSRVFCCCECETRFERWRSCAMHLWKVHKVDCGLLTCPICLTYKTATSVPLENHMRIHGEDRSFTCPECGKGFKQAAQLHNHRVMHLDRKTSELPRWYATKQCNICFKTYANSKCLKKHVQAVHSKLRPYVCQVCGHKSARKAMLQLHYRQHTGEKPHSCPLCDYRTGDHNSLRRHIMRHTGQRPYRCPHCPYSAIQSNSYKNHLRNKHPGQSGVFSCSQCSFKTVSNEGYLLHVSDHKNGVITSNYNDDSGNDVEVFPGNVAAAQLIYQCLNALSSDGTTVEANVTGSSTSADGTTQTITIQIPNQECSNEIVNENYIEEEDAVARCFLEVKQQVEEDVGMIGVIVPSESERNTLCHMVS